MNSFPELRPPGEPTEPLNQPQTPQNHQYLLVVGPGRSGSTLLYRALSTQRAFAFPEIKEGNYYRSARRYKRAMRQVRGTNGALLCDVSNRAYRRKDLRRHLQRITDGGDAVLLILLIRNHIDRARSMMRFRRSRGNLSALFGRLALERFVVADRLKPQQLRRILSLDVDVLIVEFESLVRDTQRTLHTIATVCGVAADEPFAARVVNEAVRARWVPFAAAGKTIALALRFLGFRKTLQAVKDSDSVQALFFRKELSDSRAAVLSEASESILRRTQAACCSELERLAAETAPGIRFRPRGPAGDRHPDG